VECFVEGENVRDLCRTAASWPPDSSSTVLLLNDLETGVDRTERAEERRERLSEDSLRVSGEGASSSSLKKM
jgi:hypothetical protein